MTPLAPRVPGLRDFAFIARGGFGDVWQATQDSLGRRVAVKVLREDVDPSRAAAALASFERESIAIGRLQHPNILVVHEFSRGSSGDTTDTTPIDVPATDRTDTVDLTRPEPRPYLVLEYCDNAPDIPLPWMATVAAGQQIAGALHAAHEAKIIHGDIKPNNVLWCGGVPKVADFGIAQILDSPGFDEAVGLSRHYSAPEVGRSGPSDARSDIYSLASTMIFWLSGAHPETDDRWADLAGPELSTLLRRSRGPVESRPRTMAEFAHELDAIAALGFRARTDPTTSSTDARPSRRRRSVVAAGALIALGAAGVGGLVLAGGRDEPTAIDMPTASTTYTTEPTTVPRVLTSPSSIAASTSSPTSIALDGPSGRLVFTSDRGATGGIWILDLADPDTVTFYADGRDPTLAADGTAAYVCNDRAVCLHRPDGNVALATDGPAASPAISPDGADLLWVDLSRGESGLVLASTDTLTSATPIVVSSSVEKDPSWGQGGESFVFRSDRTGQGDIYLYRKADAALRGLTDDPAIDSQPALSPNGELAVFVRRVGSTTELMMVRAVTGGLLADADEFTVVSLTSDSFSDRGPTFTTDGTHVVFESNRVTSSFALHLLHLETGEVSALAPHAGFSGDPHVG